MPLSENDIHERLSDLADQVPAASDAATDYGFHTLTAVRVALLAFAGSILQHQVIDAETDATPPDQPPTSD
jgi:hypothetical protein